jgi:hypothetical protein
MNQLLVRDLHEALGPRTAGQCTGLGCEPSLRVATATLSRTRSQDITATTVVGGLGRDDRAAVEGPRCGHPRRIWAGE